MYLCYRCVRFCDRELNAVAPSFPALFQRLVGFYHRLDAQWHGDTVTLTVVKADTLFAHAKLHFYVFIKYFTLAFLIFLQGYYNLY
jgi:hypothetical protein